MKNNLNINGFCFVSISLQLIFYSILLAGYLVNKKTQTTFSILTPPGHGFRLEEDHFRYLQQEMPLIVIPWYWSFNCCLNEDTNVFF